MESEYNISYAQSSSNGSGKIKEREKISKNYKSLKNRSSKGEKIRVIARLKNGAEELEKEINRGENSDPKSTNRR